MLKECLFEWILKPNKKYKGTNNFKIKMYYLQYGSSSLLLEYFSAYIAATNRLKTVSVPNVLIMFLIQ